MISSASIRPRSFRLPALLSAAAVCAVLIGCSSDNPAIDPTPTQITDLAAIALNDTTVRLTWSAPSAGGRRVATYDIRYAESEPALDSLGAHVAWPYFGTPAVPDSPDSVTISSLKRVTRYYFRVAGVASSGERDPLGSLVSIVTVPDTIPPDPITDLRVSIREDTALTLLWTAPGDDGGQGRAHAYVLLVATGVHTAIDPETSRQVRPPARPFPAGVTEILRVGGLHEKSTYSIGVLARDESGLQSQPSNVLVVTTDRSPKDWYVFANGSGDVPTIQAAIDSTRPGEVIWIGPGTYRENVRIIGQSETLIGIEGAEATIIDGSTRPASVIEIRSAMEDTTRIIGLTITGGSGSSIQQGSGEDVDGAGIFAQDAHLRVEACRIHSNGLASGPTQTAEWGGGVYAERRSQPVEPRLSMFRCDVSGNRATKNGGGIATGNGVVPHIEGCQIRSNIAADGDGGGMWIHNHRGLAVVKSCTVGSNIADDHGGGIYIGGSSGFMRPVRIHGNVIARNHANHRTAVLGPDAGGGLWLDEVAGEVNQNTIVANTTSENLIPNGSGVVSRNSAGLVIARNIIAYSGQGGGYVCYGGDTAVLTTNIFWANSGVDMYGCMGDIGDSENMSIDPLFCNVSLDDWRLHVDSPALNTTLGHIGAVTGIGCEQPPQHPSARTTTRLARERRLP